MDDAFLLAVSRVKGCSVFQGRLGLSGDEPVGFAKLCSFQPNCRVLGVALGPQVSILLGTQIRLPVACTRQEYMGKD